MRVSENGKRLLTEWEGLELRVYRDVAGLPTIGVGHLLTQDELSSGKIQIDGVATTYENGLTADQVNRLLAQDLAEFEDCVNKAIRVPLSPNQFDALVGLAFNIGKRAFMDSTLAKILNQGRYAEVPDQFRRWKHSGGQVSQGLINRREKEVALWSAAA